jgi:membrane-associated phospholipid phosphatase
MKSVLATHIPRGLFGSTTSDAAPLSERSPTLLKRASLSLALSIFFFLAYGACAAIATSRAHVPSFYFSWERHVPFVAAEIIPYLSLDAFFAIAPFLIRDDRALRAYAIRIIAAITVAAFFFVLMPLKFSFVRPPVSGWTGIIFDQFQKADPPFNQFPSLHIALLLIVADIFLRSFHGWTRAYLLVWFCLIGASPLLVYQHHFVDLIGGLALGLLCLHLIRNERYVRPSELNRRVGTYYAVAAGVLIGGCLWIGRASWPLWWPVLSLSLAAIGYWFLGPALYVKSNGRLGWTSRLLLSPTLLGQHASLHWYSHGRRPYDAVDQSLWVGRRLSSKEAAAARAGGVTAVIDLTCEFSEAPAFRSVHFLQLPTLDLTAPTQHQIDQAVAFIDEQLPGSVVYIHCKAGYSRTAVIAAAYLLASERADSVEEAIDLLRRARPSLVVRPEAWRAIVAFHRRRCDQTTRGAALHPASPRESANHCTNTSSPTFNFNAFAADPSRTAISSNPLLPIRASGSPGGTSQ